MANKNGDLIAGYYNGIYLKLNWEAIENRKTQKYNINWNVKKYGDGTRYYTWIHYLRVYFGENRFESSDVAKKAYDGDEMARGSFEIDSGDYTIELHGGIYYYAENVSNNTTVKLDAIAPLSPTVSISKVSNTATTIKVKASSNNGVTASKYKFKILKNGDIIEDSGEILLDTYEFKELTPNTQYILRAKGYGNETWGEYSDDLSITTSKQSTITNIEDFTINGTKLNLSGDGNIVVIKDGKELIRRNNIPAGEYELILTGDEKQKIYELMVNNNSINVIIRIETGNSYVDKEVNIALTGDVFSCKIKMNGVNKRCKVWVGTSNGNKQGIFTIGTSKGNRRGR